MAAWHRSRDADPGLRIAGLLLCGAACAAIRHLSAMHVAPGRADAFACALAAAGFLGASAGSAMAILGRHLFDEVALGERWRRRLPLPFSADPIDPAHDEERVPTGTACAGAVPEGGRRTGRQRLIGQR